MQLKIHQNMMGNTILFLWLLGTLLAVVGVANALSLTEGPVIVDVPYGQTISNQQLFSDLPFKSVTDALYDANGFCYVALSSNVDTPLWSAKKRLDRSGSVAASDSIYSSWRVIESDGQNILPSGPFLKLVKTPDSILLISSSSIFEIVLDFNCTALMSVRRLTDPASPTLGEVLSVSYADVPSSAEGKSSQPALWLGTTQGLFLLTPLTSETSATWHVVQISEIGEAVTSLLWVSPWARLFAGTSVALYEVQLDAGILSHLRDGEHSTASGERFHAVHASSSSYQIQYQWIGGNLDFEVKELTYDFAFDCVWAVQQEALHQRREDGTWWRQGHYQGLITNDLTSLAVTQQTFDTLSHTSASLPSSHFVWVGTKSKGLLRRQARYSTNEDTVQEDPWQQWLLFYGARFFPDGEVLRLVSDDNNDHTKHAERKQSTLLVVTQLGVSFLTTQEWRLADKEVVMQSFQYPRHDRHGIVAEVSLAVAGDTSRWSHACEDSDGIWTAQYAVAASMRYAHTQVASDRASAWKTFESLERLGQLSGVRGLIGRTFCSPEEVAGEGINGGANGATAGCGVDGEGNWHASTTFPGWVWKGDTSSDTIDGHYYAYGVVLDLVAETTDEQARVYQCIDDLTSYIVDNDLYYLDVGGEPTKWGRWNPADLNDNADFYSERGLNSLEILAYLALGYSVTGKDEFLSQFQSLTEKHGYYDNALNQKIDNPFEDNHSDNELGHMAYHTLFYSLYRLQYAIDHEKLPYLVKDVSVLMARRDTLLAMTTPLVPSLQRWWSIVKHERSPLWLSVVAGAGGVPVSEETLRRAVESLRLYSADLINWSVHNSGRWDCQEQPYYGRDNPDMVLMRHIRPPQERATGHYNTDPFALDSAHGAADAYSEGGGGGAEYSPAEWLLPYWSLRYYGLLESAEA